MDQRLLEGVHFAMGRDAFDGQNLGSVPIGCQQQARSHRQAAAKHGAGPAVAGIAAATRPYQVQVLSGSREGPAPRGVGVGVVGLLEQHDVALRGPARTVCEEQVIGVDLLLKLTKRLDRKSCEILVYRYIDDLPQEAIATRVGPSRSANGKPLQKHDAQVAVPPAGPGRGDGGCWAFQQSLTVSFNRPSHRF